MKRCVLFVRRQPDFLVSRSAVSEHLRDGGVETTVAGLSSAYRAYACTVKERISVESWAPSISRSCQERDAHKRNWELDCFNLLQAALIQLVLLKRLHTRGDATKLGQLQLLQMLVTEISSTSSSTSATILIYSDPPYCWLGKNPPTYESRPSL